MITTQFDEDEKKESVEPAIGGSNSFDCYNNFVSNFEIKVNFSE